ncbi:MAG: ATP synthase F1 subunit delta [Acidimicrobiia bacterium]
MSKIEAYAKAMLEVASASGHLEGIEDDLFRFARTFEGSDDLRLALTDPQLPIERRIAVIDQLMDGKALQASTALVGMVVAVGQASELPAIVERFVELAASERDHEVAEVRSAIPLDDTQVQRLAAALSKATGKTIEVKVIIDPAVLGGLVARVGDTVIDGTVRHRIEEMKEQL